MAETRRRKASTTSRARRPRKGTAAGLSAAEQAQVNDIPVPPPNPMADFDNKLAALLSEYDPQVGTLAIVKMLHVTADDLIFSAIAGMSEQARDQAVHSALSQIGAARNFRTKRNKKAGKK